MPQDKGLILVFNGGSSSIKFAVYEGGGPLQRILGGAVEGIGQAGAKLRVKGQNGADAISRPLRAQGHTEAVAELMDWVEERFGGGAIVALGHRVVQGGPKFFRPTLVSPAVLDELKRLSPFDPDHLPGEIQLIEAAQQRYPGLPQVACFDTAFHHGMPRLARLLPIPLRYEAQGLRRYGFHGLSYEYLIGELAHAAGDVAAKGRVILAHLGSGASLAALRGGVSVDTSMGFTPASGLVMGSRSGDLDPGLFGYLARSENMDARGFDAMVNLKSGLLGLSETSSDMQGLLAKEAQDPRAADAVGLFCYQAKKWIGSFAAVLGGLDTLVFSGGIGENAPLVRQRICHGLGFLGVDIEDGRNDAGAAVISRFGATATVRVIRTDEELMIARMTQSLLGGPNL